MSDDDVSVGDLVLTAAFGEMMHSSPSLTVLGLVLGRSPHLPIYKVLISDREHREWEVCFRPPSLMVSLCKRPS